MSLVKTLHNEIVDPNIAVSTVLLKAKILAATLDNEKFTSWLDSELNGYNKDGHPLPDYRFIDSPLLGNFQGPGGTVSDYRIPVSMLPDYMQDRCEKLSIAQSLKELESLTANHSDQLRTTWPTELVILLRNSVRFPGMELVEIYQQITTSMLERILGVVRNKFLEFLLGLQKINPDILKSEEAIGNLPPDRVQNVFNINVYGNHNVIPTQSTVGDILIQSISQDDFESLRTYLENHGVSSEDTNELQNAIQSDGQPEKEKLGGGVGGWIGGMVTKSISGAWKSTVGAATTKVLTDAIFKYYGWM